MAQQVPVNFALAPALVEDGVIDYSTRTGAKLYETAVEALNIEFDCQPGNLKVFLEKVKNRAMATGWNDILNVPTDLAEPDQTINLISEYGLLSLEQVRAHAETYVNAAVRAAQDSFQLYMCLMKTLTKEAQAKIMLHASEYTINGNVSGTCLLKIIIRESHIDTNATTSFIRDRLSKLDEYIKTIGSDIDKFNTYVNNQLDSLHARGEDTSDLLTYLFKGYFAASDRVFITYIQDKQDKYNEGQAMPPQLLMQLALNKYKTLVEAGKWNAPSDEEAKIIALEAEIKKLAAKKQPPQATKGKARKGKDKRKDKNQNRRNRPAWAYVKPKPGEPQKRTREGKDFWWCDKHGYWAGHLTEACRGQGIPGADSEKSASNKNNDNKKGQQRNNNNKALKISKALATIVEDADDQSDEE